MKPWHLSSAIVFLCVFLSGSGFPATYDLTGQVTVIAKDHWNDCGLSNPDTEESTIILIQRDDSFSVYDIEEGFIFEASVNGAQYNVLTDHCMEEDEVELFCAPMTCTLTATSDSNATGRCNWKYSNGYTCSGGHNISMTKAYQSNPTYNATGLWIYSEQAGGSNDCGVPNPAPASGTLIINQTGNKATAVDNSGKQYDGFVSGSTYMMVTHYYESARTVSRIQSITLGGGGTSGTGSCKWFWEEEPDTLCGGQLPLLVEKAWTIMASAGPGGTISPSGSTVVPHDGDRLITITPNRGYQVQDVLVDGVSVGATGTYTFSNVRTDHTIEAVFRKIASLPFLQLLLED